MKTAELAGAQLDYWVAKAEGYAASLRQGHLRISRSGGFDLAEKGYTPSTDWAQGGPIIERERIACARFDYSYDGRPEANCWMAEYVDGGGYFASVDFGRWCGPTPLIAAMRAFVASKFGEEVQDV